GGGRGPMSTGGTRAPRTAAAAPGGLKAKAAGDGAPRLHAEGASRDARRLAAAILEVLAGVRTPAEAAQQLAISLTRYDIVEGRALHGLVAACEPRPLGRGGAPAGGPGEAGGGGGGVGGGGGPRRRR